jgi:1,4-dihydroxy-2-naphthoyl-CoA hydrolase
MEALGFRGYWDGYFAGRSAPLGRRNQVWEVRIVDGDDRLVCISRCTMAVLDAPL